MLASNHSPSPPTPRLQLLPTSNHSPPGSIEVYDWCHGAISRNGAEYLLKQHNVEGMYLVRESQSQPGQVCPAPPPPRPQAPAFAHCITHALLCRLQYTLDVWSEGKAIHYRISKNSDDGYFFRQSRRPLHTGL